MREAISTDVLVLGGGGAGLCSAIAAAEAGASVLLISKSGGNSTAIAAGGFAAVMPEEEKDSQSLFVEDALHSGAGLADRALLERLAAGAPEAIRTVSDWGVEFYCREDGSYRPFRSGGHSLPRSYRCASGRGGDAYRIFLERAKRLGVVMKKNALITELLCAEGRVVGAAGMDEKGEPLFLQAGAVILATGGMAALYEQTTNTPGMTGEGYILAWEAGCQLRDLEFIQCMPTTLAYPPQMKGKLVNDTLRGEGAKLLNRDNERFMARYDPKFMEVATRDVLSAAITAEWQAGRGSEHGGVYLDARHIPRKAMLESFGVARQLIAAGIDPSDHLIEVTPAAHFSCGGVAIDGECRTGVAGLYAVGEVSGGIHGANRLGATALTENVVFGTIAGRNAAREAKDGNCICLPQGGYVAVAMKLGEDTLNPELTCALEEEEQEVRRLLWRHGGILRSAAGLAEGMKGLKKCRDRLKQFPDGNFCQALQNRRLFQLITLGELTLQAAEARTESRGCHRRTDFPNVDSKQAQSKFFEKNG